MKANFHANQILYVNGIGYARLAIDRPNHTKTDNSTNPVQNANQTQSPQENQESVDGILFDPEMFKIDSDSPFAEHNVEVNLCQHNTRKKSVEVLRRHPSEIKNRQAIIVPLKLQNTNAMIYCPDNYLMKKITIVVKSLLQNCRKEIQISIQITKTIDNFKNLIFKELGEDIVYYSDVRMFLTNPKFEQLNVGSKTIWQYQLKDRSKITLTAKFNFTFKSLPEYMIQYLALSNNNNTVCTLQKKPQVPKTAQNATVQPVTIQKIADTEKPKGQLETVSTVPLVLESNQKSEQTDKKEGNKVENIAENKTKPEKFNLECNVKFRSGIHYWEFKIDKLNLNKESDYLLIGICMKNQLSSQNQDYVHLWAFNPFRSKKVQFSGQKKPKSSDKDDKELNASDESDQQYGCNAKNGDTIGVLLIIKDRKATLVFYKNSTCLEECYEFSIQKLKGKEQKNNFYLAPFVSMAGEMQLTLDSKAVAPLDSFRFK